MTRNWFALSSPPDLTEAVIDVSYIPDLEMLTATGTVQEAWHSQASQATASRFGRNVFVRGVVEVSNFCRENCSYCGMRRDNRTLERYRAHFEQIAEMLIHHRPAAITDINIQTGEDPIVVRDVVIPLIQAIRRETPLGVSVCLGTLNASLYSELQGAGASIYIIKFEIADPKQYAEMQAPGSFTERIDHIKLLAANGWNVSSGFIADLPGQDKAQLLANFTLARSLPLSGCSVSPFIPGDDTPLTQSPTADIDLTLNCMAALRLMKPDWVIPAVSALNLADRDSGYRRGLRTGANLVTMNLTPSEVRGNYVLYKKERFIMTEERILHAIAAESLSPSSQSLADYYRNERASLLQTRTETVTKAA
jgi:biotin synthase